MRPPRFDAPASFKEPGVLQLPRLFALLLTRAAEAVGRRCRRGQRARSLIVGRHVVGGIRVEGCCEQLQLAATDSQLAVPAAVDGNAARAARLDELDRRCEPAETRRFDVD